MSFVLFRSFKLSVLVGFLYLIPVINDALCQAEQGLLDGKLIRVKTGAVGDVITGEVTIVNRSASAVRIKSIKTSCGCFEIVNWPRSVGPNSTAAIKFSAKQSNFRQKAQSHSLWIESSLGTEITEVVFENSQFVEVENQQLIWMEGAARSEMSAFINFSNQAIISSVKSLRRPKGYEITVLPVDANKVIWEIVVVPNKTDVSEAPSRYWFEVKDCLGNTFDSWVALATRVPGINH